jgi:hypothetical protein
MKYAKTGMAFALALGTLFALTGCDKIKAATGLGEGGVTAENMGQVRVVRLNANSCQSGIRGGLGERGFSVTSSEGKVDAVLDVSVNHSGRNMDNIPSFGGVGNKASYSATLKGKGDKVLFSTSGSEGSINMDELCEDIGDEIGERMQDRRGG